MKQPFTLLVYANKAAAAAKEIDSRVIQIAPHVNRKLNSRIALSSIIFCTNLPFLLERYGILGRDAFCVMFCDYFEGIKSGFDVSFCLMCCVFFNLDFNLAL